MKRRAMRVGNTRLSEAYMFQEPFSATRREPMLVHMRSSITDHNTHKVATRRSTRWGAMLAVMVALVTASAVAAPPVVVSPES